VTVEVPLSLRGPRCTCIAPDGATRNHATGCPLFSVYLAYQQGVADERAALAPAAPSPDDAECETCDGSFRHEWPCPAILRCDVEGCDREATCGFPSPGGYLHVCGAHFDPEARA
jgi:hypothetical protein